MIPSVRICAVALVILLGGMALFQLALALGAPWGAYAMGGAFPGVYPPAMRFAAVAQMFIYAAIAVVALARSGLAFRPLAPMSRWVMWALVVLFAVSLVLNLITPSGGERMVWAPVALLMLLLSLRLALAPRY